MNIPHLHFKDLFAQLGLANDNESICYFIDTNGQLDLSVSLADATFWSYAQATFLREQILADADWVGLVDQLNCALRSGSHPKGAMRWQPNLL